MAVKLAEENEELVKVLSHTLRRIMPHEYARGLEAGVMMRKEEGMELLFQAWYGVSLNEGMPRKRGMVHKDTIDHGMNSTVP